MIPSNISLELILFLLITSNFTRIIVKQMMVKDLFYPASRKNVHFKFVQKEWNDVVMSNAGGYMKRRHVVLKRKKK